MTNEETTPEQRAKATVARVFAALHAFPDDVKWQELLRGGRWQVEAAISGGRLTGFAAHDGEFSIAASKNWGDCQMTLMSGSCAERTTADVGGASKIRHPKAPATDEAETQSVHSGRETADGQRRPKVS